MDAKPIRILLVEDNPGDARLVKEMLFDTDVTHRLEATLFELIHKDHLQPALAMLTSEPFDIVLVDLSLPDSQGLGTVKEVCRVAPHLPVIVLSGHTDETIATQAVKEGAQDYLLKGRIDNPLLVRAIRYAIERKQIDLQLKQLAYFDALTGVANRLQLMQGIKHALAMARRYKWKIAILFLDIDQFKMINDGLGHTAGDYVLQEVTKKLVSTTRESDLVARLGGDEFVLLLDKVNGESDVASVAKKILIKIREPMTFEGHKIFVTGSIGISLFPENGEDEETLLKNADIAMYKAKQSGRNNFQFCMEEMTQAIQQKINLEGELYDALEQKKFILRYQPQIDLKKGNIGGVEALLCLPRPDGSLLLSSGLLPIAEQSGLIIPIGEWVLNVACMQKKQWQEAKLSHLMMSIAVNLSLRQLKEASLILAMQKILKETNLEPQYIELEINETALMQDVEHSAKIIKEFKELGVRVALDNFGVGYSSLNYFRQLHFDTLKIDRSFIKNIPQNTQDSAVVAAIIMMAHAMDILVIAEGVETKEQFQFLVEHQCDRAQGFYFSQPVDAVEIAKLIKEERQWTV